MSVVSSDIFPVQIPCNLTTNHHLCITTARSMLNQPTLRRLPHDGPSPPSRPPSPVRQAEHTNVANGPARTRLFADKTRGRDVVSRRVVL